MVLHRQIRGSGFPFVFLHGLFGSGDNLSSLAGRMTGLEVRLFDLRGHGRSPRGEMTRQALADDVADTMRQLGLPPCVVAGHSLGGKIALEVALKYPGLVTGVIALDMGVRDYDPQYSSYLTAMRGLDLAHVGSRDDARKQLDGHIDAVTLAFLLKSLVPDEQKSGRWKWLLDLEALTDAYPTLWRGVTKEVAPSTVPALFLSGGASDYVRPGDEGAILERFPRATMVAVAGAGHWVHADRPAEVLAAMNRWLGSEHLAEVPPWT